MLVAALERGAELGECVEMIETALAKKPLPGDCNKDYRKVRCGSRPRVPTLLI